jgi:hypothetical protein
MWELKKCLLAWTRENLSCMTFAMKLSWNHGLWTSLGYCCSAWRDAATGNSLWAAYLGWVSSSSGGSASRNGLGYTGTMQLGRLIRLPKGGRLSKLDKIDSSRWTWRGSRSEQSCLLKLKYKLWKPRIKRGNFSLQEIQATSSCWIWATSNIIF